MPILVRGRGEGGGSHAGRRLLEGKGEGGERKGREGRRI